MSGCVSTTIIERHAKILAGEDSKTLARNPDTRTAMCDVS